MGVEPKERLGFKYCRSQIKRYLLCYKDSWKKVYWCPIFIDWTSFCCDMSVRCQLVKARCVNKVHASRGLGAGGCLCKRKMGVKLVGGALIFLRGLVTP